MNREQIAPEVVEERIRAALNGRPPEERIVFIKGGSTVKYDYADGDRWEPEGSVMQRLVRALDAHVDFVKENERGFLYYRDLGNLETTVGPLSAWANEQTAAALRPCLKKACRAVKSETRTFTAPPC